MLELCRQWEHSRPWGHCQYERCWNSAGSRGTECTGVMVNTNDARTLQAVGVQHALGSLSTRTMLETLQALGAQQTLESLSTQSLLLLPLNHHQSLRTHLNQLLFRSLGSLPSVLESSSSFCCHGQDLRKLEKDLWIASWEDRD